MFTRIPRILMIAIVGVLTLGIGVGTALLAVATPRHGVARVFGVADPQLLYEPAATQVAELQAMKAIGITSVRLDANWYYGEPAPNTFEAKWTKIVFGSTRAAFPSAFVPSTMMNADDHE